MPENKYDCRFSIILPAYDPYKDAFDIFMDLFEKNWPDCPYPVVVTNMFFQYESSLPNFHLKNCGDEKRYRVRRTEAINMVKAKYYLIMEEDRMFTGKIDTREIEKILDFMDENDIEYYRMNPSFFKKKKKAKFEGYEHFYHIPAKEPYGRSGATSIYRIDLIERNSKKYADAYCEENGYLEDSFNATEKYLAKAATDDRNILHILHCIDKSQWIPAAKRELEKMGYDLSDTTLKTLSKKRNIVQKCKYVIGNRVPIKFRYYIKKFLSKFGMKFSTKY